MLPGHDAALPGEAHRRFRQTWEANPVRAPGHRTKSMAHPEAGALRINCDVLTIADDDQQVVFMTADPGSASARALHHLAASDRR